MVNMTTRMTLYLERMALLTYVIVLMMSCTYPISNTLSIWNSSLGSMQLYAFAQNFDNDIDDDKGDHMNTKFVE